MDDIKQKINTYIHIAIARERMLRNKGLDIRGVVEQTLRVLISGEETGENIETDTLFNLQKFEYIDQSSLMYPHKSQQVLHNTESEYFELSKEELERQKYILEQEAMDIHYTDTQDGRTDAVFANFRAVNTVAKMKQNTLLNNADTKELTKQKL